jgi:hypothetical protein
MYEYSTKRQLSGMGWSEVGFVQGTLFRGGWCPGSNKDRRICAIDNAADRATMQEAGCIRPVSLLSNNIVDSCGTSSGYTGTVWCCPADNPRTPEQRAAAQTSAPGQSSTTTPGRETVAPPIVNADIPREDEQPKTPAPEQSSVAPVGGGALKEGSVFWKVFAAVGCAFFAYNGYNYLVSTGRI